MAERLQNEPARETIDREISWQLRLNRGKDYLISSMARLNFEQTVVVPNQASPITVKAEFIVVNPYGAKAAEQLVNDTENHWLSREELLAGNSENGTPVSEFCVALLKAADVISHAD